MASIDVVLIQACLGARAVVSVGLVEIALFGADPERGGLIVGEVEGRDGHFAGFVVTGVDKLEGFL